jgi:predicted nuclease of restriction endonuclease-like (RecB) superfamily
MLESEYVQFIKELKQQIINSRYIAARLVNREQLLLYFQTGKSLSEKITKNQWGAKVVDQIASDLQKDLPGLRGFSRRNLLNMRQFYETYKDISIVQSMTAQFENFPQNADEKAFFSLSFTHHLLLITKCKDWKERSFYIQSASNEFWPVSVLQYQIEAGLFYHQGKLPNNFAKTIPEVHNNALAMFRDEYLLDYIQVGEDDTERMIEKKVVFSIRDFILRAGKGFCFIGNQYRIQVDGEDFFVDLLFFNRLLRCMVVFEIKRDKFRPADAGQLNFYLNVLNEQEKLPEENPAIGIVLCKEKNNSVVEFSVKNIDVPMGVATYKTTRQLPDRLRGILPEPGEITKLL